MIKKLQLTNVGPAPSLELEFADRLNIITGDNGLGKSFLLDMAWWALTRTWPAEVNPKLTMGLKAFPGSDNKAEIIAHFKGRMNIDDIVARYGYHWQSQQWIPATVSPVGETLHPNPQDTSRLVIYAMADGSFAVWDRARNFKSYNSNDLSGGNEVDYSLLGPRE